jgi:hypothetical protein
LYLLPSRVGNHFKKIQRGAADIRAVDNVFRVSFALS